MSRLPAIVPATLCVALLSMVADNPSYAQVTPGIERLYRIYCGEGTAGDISLWSPGVNVGKSAEFSVNCYLIKHAQGWLLWDTGITDQIAALPEGDRSNPRLTLRRSKTLASQLDQLGIAPAGIKYVAISHRHPDHAGNLPVFAKSTLLVQRA